MIKLSRIKAIASKEFIQVMRDPRSRALGLAIPIILIFLFGYALSLDIKDVPVAVWDRDHSKTSFDFLLNFRNSEYFKIIGYYDSYEDIERLINYNEALMAIVIPKDFSQYIFRSEAAPVQLIIDGSDSNTAQVASGYVMSVVSTYNTNLLKSVYGGVSAFNPNGIDMRQRVWFNQDFESKNFIVPGLIAIIMMIIAALLTSLTVAREWERGTMEQLIATPVKPAELIIGKFVPYFVIGIIDLVLSVIMGKFVFDVPLRGNLVLLFFSSTLFLTGSLAMGIFISAVAKNQLMASQMAMLISFLPTFLLSGFTYEIFNMPPFVQAITHLVPARYFITILRGIYLKAVGIDDLWKEHACLIIFALLLSFLAIRGFKKKVA